MATVYGEWVSTDDFRAILDYSTSQTNDTMTFTMTGRAQMQYGYNNTGMSQLEYTLNGGPYRVLQQIRNITYPQWTTIQTSGPVSFTIAKNLSTQTVHLQHWFSDPNIGIGSYNTGSRAWVDITIPARTYVTHGNPTLTASNTKPRYGESITLSWAKSGTQGNANFDHFEVALGGKQIYSGTGTSITITPSDYTGATGGELIFTVKEVHEWYGTYPSTQTSITIEVKSGVVTVYDNTGAKKTGLVTVYDSSGNACSVMITVYDSSGNACNST